MLEYSSLVLDNLTSNYFFIVGAVVIFPYIFVPMTIILISIASNNTTFEVFMLCILGYFISIFVGYYLARPIAKYFPYFDKKSTDLYAKYSKKTVNDFIFVLIIRNIGIPFVVGNVVCGLFRISIRQYVWSSMLSFFPWIIAIFAFPALLDSYGMYRYSLILLILASIFTLFFIKKKAEQINNNVTESIK